MSGSNGIKFCDADRARNRAAWKIRWKDTEMTSKVIERVNTITFFWFYEAVSHQSGRRTYRKIWNKIKTKEKKYSALAFTALVSGRNYTLLFHTQVYRFEEEMLQQQQQRGGKLEARKKLGIFPRPTTNQAAYRSGEGLEILKHFKEISPTLNIWLSFNSILM